MPASHPSLYTDPAEVAAWQALKAAEDALELALLQMPGVMPEVEGSIYYLDASSRMVCAPALLDGTPDRCAELHRDDYEGVGAEDMNRIASGIREWLAKHHVATEREACAQLCELSPSQLRLMAGEMTAQELRTVQAVLTSRAAAIRARGR